MLAIWEEGGPDNNGVIPALWHRPCKAGSVHFLPDKEELGVQRWIPGRALCASLSPETGQWREGRPIHLGLFLVSASKGRCLEHSLLCQPSSGKQPHSHRHLRWPSAEGGRGQ